MTNNNQEIKLSIIIPHYNRPKLLKRLLESILEEYCNDTEIIVIDDNSTIDVDLYESCKEIYSERVYFLTNDTNKNSAGTCRNIGINKSKGKWLLFCDSDDYLLEGWYTKVSQFFESKNDVIFFTPKSIDETTGKSSGREKKYEKLISDFKECKYASGSKLRYSWESPWSKMIKKSLIENNNILFESIILGNDVLFSTKVGYYMNTFSAISQNIYCITKGLDNITSDKSEVAYWKRVNVSIRKYIFLRNNIKNSKEWIESGIVVKPLTMVIESVKRGYSFSYIWKLVILCKSNRVHIISIDVIKYIHILIKRRLVKM